MCNRVNDFYEDLRDKWVKSLYYVKLIVYVFIKLFSVVIILFLN